MRDGPIFFRFRGVRDGLKIVSRKTKMEFLPNTYLKKMEFLPNTLYFGICMAISFNNSSYRYIWLGR